MFKVLLGNPYVLIGIAVAFALSIGSAIWFKHEASVARKGEAAAVELARLKDEDAKRWEAAWSVSTARVTELGTTLDQQSAEIAKGRAKESALRQSLDSARQQNDRLSADLDVMRREVEEEARQAPGDIRSVGPIVARRAPSLFE